MTHFGKRVKRGRTHALGWTCRRVKLRKFLLEIEQLNKKRVISRIGDFRCIQRIIQPLMAMYLGSQLLNSIVCLCCIHTPKYIADNSLKQEMPGIFTEQSILCILHPARSLGVVCLLVISERYGRLHRRSIILARHRRIHRDSTGKLRSPRTVIRRNNRKSTLQSRTIFHTYQCI